MTSAELPAGLVDRLGSYLGAQRWYAGSGEPAAADIVVVASRELCATEEGTRHLHWVVVEVEGERYQLLIGQRPAGEAAEFLNGNERGLIAAHDDVYYYDGVLDPDLCLRFLGVVTAGTQLAQRVRPISAEQSNTSLVFDERIIVKLYRRLAEGANPDVEVTNALARVGFTHVAAPYATWREGGMDLAFAQAYLVGGTDGWALAQTSLRDFYNSDDEDPAQAGGDFAGEATRLGRVTAELHLALREAFGREEGRLAAGDWDILVDGLEGGLGAYDGIATGETVALIDRLRAVPAPGPAQRVHGDYHLGQVMRTDAGWFVLDFEGEPARPIHQRLLPASPLKDVAGMLRSFDYATRAALRERWATSPGAQAKALAWEKHNRAAFLAGYLTVPGADELLAATSHRDLVLAGYELEKALYELAYEQSYRPSWVPIPAGAIDRILGLLA
jgi:maltokinase